MYEKLHKLQHYSTSKCQNQDHIEVEPKYWVNKSIINFKI